MKLRIFSLFLMFYACILCAQENRVPAQIAPADSTEQVKTWEYELDLGVNLLNVGLTNWMGGGATFLSFGTRNMLRWAWNGEHLFWLNRLDLAYGALYNYHPTAAFPYRKTDDLLSYSTSLDYILTKHWSVVLLGNFFITQFAEGFAYNVNDEGQTLRTKVSDFMSPAYNYTYVGVRYRYREKKTSFMIVLSPLAYQQIIVKSNYLTALGLFAPPAGHHWEGHFGWLIDAQFEQKFYKDMRFWSNLFVFDRYAQVQGFTINWDTGLEMKMLKYFFLNFGTSLIYDYYTTVLRDDGSYGRAVQFKYMLNFGLLMKLTNIKEKEKPKS